MLYDVNKLPCAVDTANTNKPLEITPHPPQYNRNLISILNGGENLWLHLVISKL